MTHRRPLTTLTLTGLVAALTAACGSAPARQDQSAADPSTATSPPAATSRTPTPAPAPPAPPPPAPAAHHVVYTWGTSRPLRGDEAGLVAIGWNNPVTGRSEQADPLGPQLRFPYSKQFDVPSLQVDNRHVSAGATIDTPGVIVDCAITVDGRVIDASTGDQATMAADGTVENSGETLCVPNR